jgi:hypothetical protein
VVLEPASKKASEITKRDIFQDSLKSARCWKRADDPLRRDTGAIPDDRQASLVSGAFGRVDGSCTR